MISRIAVLAVLVTVTCWLGQLGGCASSGQDQNYKMLDEDRPMFETRPDLNKPGASITTPRTHASFILAAPEPAEPAQVEIDRTKINSDDLAPVKNTPVTPGDLQIAAGETNQSEAATARAIEDALAAAPPEGRSINGLDRSHWSTVTVGPDLSASYRVSYFQEADAHTNVWCLIAFERLCFAAQVVALPVKMIITPPWTKTSGSDNHCTACSKTADNADHHMKHAHSDACCGEAAGACCEDSMSLFPVATHQKIAGNESVPVTKAAAPLETGCSRGNHTGCVQCNCTGLKTTDKDTCASCCI